LTDIELVAEAVSGNEDAFGRLYTKYFAFARNVAAKLTPDPDDAAQLVFQWLLENRWRPQPYVVTDNGNIFGLIRKLSVFAAWRTLAPREETGAADGETAYRLAVSNTRSPEQILLARELRERIARAIAALPPRYRATARLRFYRELSGPEIARCLHIDRATVPGYFNVIRQRLRPVFADVVELPAVGGRARGSTRHIRIDDGRYARRAP
jgi:RNA polymerase sigma factor (sigma-70 family)